MNKPFLAFLVIFLVGVQAHAQDDLMKMLQESERNDTREVQATFKGVRVVNGHSVETRSAGNLEFLIQHRFGNVDGSLYELFGIDQAQIRFGLDYSPTDELTIGLGRSSYLKTYDAFAKWKIFAQRKGAKAMPVSLTLLGSVAYETIKQSDSQLDDPVNRTAYTSQLLVARKLNDWLSLQVMPTLVHKNLVQPSENNQLFAVGFAGRAKLNKRLALSFEYYLRTGGKLLDETYNPLSLGLDIDTGGHVFQFHISSSQGMINEQLVPRTGGDFFGGDIHIGFNISRSFQIH